MVGSDSRASQNWLVIVVGGHTRSVGKTQLVCDLIRTLPEANWIAGKITQYGHGVCARNGENCDCAPSEHAAALDWETRNDTGTDTARFLAAGAKRSLWLRTKQGYLAEGLPLLRGALEGVKGMGGQGADNLILESNSLLQFLRPALYLVALDPVREDFKDSARLYLDRADALIFRSPLKAGLDGSPGEQPAWGGMPLRLLQGKESFVQREGEPLPQSLIELVRGVLRTGVSGAI